MGDHLHAGPQSFIPFHDDLLTGLDFTDDLDHDDINLLSEIIQDVDYD